MKQAAYDAFRGTPEPTPEPPLAAVHQAITAGCTGRFVTWAPGKAVPKPKPKTHRKPAPRHKPKPHVKGKPAFHKPKPHAKHH